MARFFPFVHPIWLVGHPCAKNSADARECETRLAREGAFFSFFSFFFFLSRKNENSCISLSAGLDLVYDYCLSCYLASMGSDVARIHVHKQRVTRYTRGEDTRKRVFMAKVVHCTHWMLRTAILYPSAHVTVNYPL